MGAGHLCNERVVWKKTGRSRVAISTQRDKDASQAVSRRDQLDRELQRWLPILIDHEQPDKIILFGSYSTDQVDEWSDLDIVVIKKTRLRFLDRTRRVLELLQPQVGVDVLVYTPQEFEQLCRERAFFRQEILEKGKVVYERDS
jgi:predicted nucleotidyltransferase